MTAEVHAEPRWAGALAWSLWALALVLAGAGMWLLHLTEGAPRTEAASLSWGTVLEGLAFVLGGVVGAVIASRRPRLPIGWLLLMITLGFPLVDAADGYARYATWTGTELPAWRWAAWVTNWAWALTPVGLPILLLLFPTGTPLSRRWALLVRLAWLELGLLVVVLALTPGPLDMFPEISNPAGWSVLPSISGDGLGPVFGPLFIGLEVLTLIGLLGLAVRYRRSVGEERLQMKWVAWGAAVLVPTVLAGPFLPAGVTVPAQAVGGAVLMAALAIALLRYRLYEIDRVVSRTVTYAVVTGVLVAVYAGSVLALRPLGDPFTGGSDVAVAGSTLVTAALFGPLRRRVQAVVDRRFNRRQYDAARAVESFGQRLRDEVDLQALGDDLRATVAATIQPTTVSVWLAAPEERR